MPPRYDTISALITDDHAFTRVLPNDVLIGLGRSNDRVFEAEDGTSERQTATFRTSGGRGKERPATLGDPAESGAITAFINTLRFDNAAMVKEILIAMPKIAPEKTRFQQR